MTSGPIRQTLPPGSAEDQALIQQLQAVRTRLEDRFRRAGDSMAAALNRLETLIGLLDRLTGAVEGQAAREAVSALQGTATELSCLPERQAGRRDALVALAERSAAVNANVEEMRRSLRYLGVFATNLKIAAAGAGEFADFSEEMAEGIKAGGGRLGRFGRDLGALNGQLSQALALGAGLKDDCETGLPKVIGALHTDAEAIAAHNRELSQIAGRVGELARQARAKVGSALVALQIGDSTRQRLEHIEAGLALAETEAGIDDAGARMRAAVRRLMTAQLTDLAERFAVDAAKVSDNLLGLGKDAGAILGLKASAVDGRAGGFLKTLEDSVETAHRMVSQVGRANAEADAVGRATGESAKALLADVDAISDIQTDIGHMALNTSLQCSRMGEAGKPMNVIASELRLGAKQLEAVARSTMSDLDGLAEAARRMGEAPAAEDDLGAALREASGVIREAAQTAQAALTDLDRQGEDVAAAIRALGDQAGFHADLQDELEAVCEAMTDAAGDADPETADIGEQLDGLLGRIFRTYTMAREREVHGRFAAVSSATPAPAPASAADDEDDDLAAILF